MKISIFKNSFFILTLVLLGCKTSKLNNKQKNNFKGSITFQVTTKIENEQQFDKELNFYFRKRDSLYKLNNPNDNMGSIVPTLSLALDPRENSSRFNSYHNPQYLVYKYSDSLITYNFSNFKVVINKLTNDYKRYSLKTNKLTKVKKYSFYYSDKPYKEIIYKDSIKNVNGFNCYKVIILEEAGDDNDSKKYKEMYVTEEIQSLYHPVQIRQELLKKYYPLEVKLYSDFLSDKVTYYKVKSIEVYNL